METKDLKNRTENIAAQLYTLTAANVTTQLRGTAQNAIVHMKKQAEVLEDRDAELNTLKSFLRLLLIDTRIPPDRRFEILQHMLPEYSTEELQLMLDILSKLHGVTTHDLRTIRNSTKS